MKKAIIVLPFIIGKCQSCSVMEGVEYIASVNNLLECIDVEGTFTISDFTNPVHIDLSNCALSPDASDCNNIISTFIEKNDNSLVSGIGERIMNDPENSCSCITSAALNLDNCWSDIDQYALYCKSFVVGYSSSPENCDDDIKKNCKSVTTIPQILSCLEVCNYYFSFTAAYH